MQQLTETSLDERLRLEGWSLHERLAWAVAHGSAPSPPAERLERLGPWRELIAPDQPANFDKRLQWDGLSPEMAAWALQPDPADGPQDPPEWWSLLIGLRQAGRDGFTFPGLCERGCQKPFVHLWRPVVGWALKTLQQRCTDLSLPLQLTAAAWLDLAEALLERLCSTSDQALWEQFNQRRTPGQMLLAHLGPNGDGLGEPVHEAYDAFVAEQRSSGYGLLLSEFPVLGRLLAVIIQLWLDSSEEMLRRLATDRSALQQSFGIAQTDRLAGVQLGLSDPHRGGRVVAILSFGDGAGAPVRKLVYKPKDMQVDQTYQQFLQVLNDASSLEPLRRLEVLSCAGHGYMEWVEHQPCSDDKELEKFYFNAGRLMAILHVLGCTDCHHENLIASASQLVLIDTETLLEADPRDLISDDTDGDNAPSELQTSMRGSVLRSGLLPQWLMVGDGRKFAVDISALGIQPPPPQREIPGWLGLNSDGMMAGRLRQPCVLPTSLPVGLGSPQRLGDFVDALCNGFAQQLQETIRLRQPLLQALQQFSDQPRRLVARATRLYFTIQRQMLTPTGLRSAVAHGLKLEQLSRSFVLARDTPANWPMFRAEVLQMERLDIPFFEHLIDAEELPLPEGLAAIPDFMKASGLEAACRRLESLDQAEIGFQEQLIRGAIAARQLRAAPPVEPLASAAESPAASPVIQPQTTEWPMDHWRAEAFRLGEELWARAIRDRHGRPEWLGMDLGADGETFQFGLIGPALYSGASGVSLLFARLALASQDPAVAALWRERAWSCLAGLSELAERNNNQSLFRVVRDWAPGINGTGGILLALRLLEEAGVSEAKPLATLLIEQLRPARLQADQGIDVIAGVSGLIGALLGWNTAQTLALAIDCGDRLLTLQLEAGGWPPAGGSGQGRAPLTGFSHGAAGMAAALARLAQASGEARFAEGARRAIAYERSVFAADQGNWPDFRSNNEPTSFMLSWCHGAPGILLSRLVLQACGLADERTADERGVAQRSTMAALQSFMNPRPAEAPAHLCCGLLGLTSLLRLEALSREATLDPLVTAAETRLMQQARTSGSYSLFQVERSSLQLPGLFTGQSGVALALLEAAEGPHWLSRILSAGLLEVG